MSRLSSSDVDFFYQIEWHRSVVGDLCRVWRALFCSPAVCSHSHRGDRHHQRQRYCLSVRDPAVDVENLYRKETSLPAKEKIKINTNETLAKKYQYIIHIPPVCVAHIWQFSHLRGPCCGERISETNLSVASSVSYMIYKIIFVYPLHGHAHTIIHIIYTFIILVRGEVVGRMIIKLKIKEDGLYLTYLPYKSCLWVIQSVWEVAPSPTAGDPPGSPLSQWGEGMDAVCAHNIIPYQAHVHVYQLD